ncbi:MAG: hypothetical protein ABS81_12505 [Pseudonocardia sp. SCN 72-86]|nr:MAG: hypothetical protein ABS81_12505 [Pseudonocardia sp. SCN 72-86]
MTLDRSRTLNSITRELLVELTDAYTQLSDDGEIAVIVLEGAGRAFCSGADLDNPPGLAPAGSSPEVRRDVARYGERAVRAVREARPVTVARIHGHAIGGGALLAVANDIRIAERNTRFRVPEVTLGLPLTWGGTPLLIEELGAAVARELVLFGTEVSGQEAARLGLVHVVADGLDALDTEVSNRVAHLAGLRREVVAVTKRQFRLARSGPHSEEHLAADATDYASLISADWSPRTSADPRHR